MSSKVRAPPSLSIFPDCLPTKWDYFFPIQNRSYCLVLSIAWTNRFAQKQIVKCTLKSEVFRNEITTKIRKIIKEKTRKLYFWTCEIEKNLEKKINRKDKNFEAGLAAHYLATKEGTSSAHFSKTTTNLQYECTVEKSCQETLIELESVKDTFERS